MESRKTGWRCSVRFCQNRASSRNTSFFQYPKDERLAIWMQNCETEHLAETLSLKNSYKVCGEHFENKMFLNSTTKNSLVFNAIPTKFNDDILFQRKQLKEMSNQQSKTKIDAQIIDDLNSSSNSAPGLEGLTSVSIVSNDISNESCCSIGTSDLSVQTPGYLSANTPRKQKMVVIFLPEDFEMNANERNIEHEKEMINKYNQENLSYYEQFIEVIYVDDIEDSNKNECGKLIHKNYQKSLSNDGPCTIEYCTESENKTKSSCNNLVGKIKVRDIRMMIDHNLSFEMYNESFC